MSSLLGTRMTLALRVPAGTQEARPDHVRVESSSCCFPRELMSFFSP